MNKFLKLVDVKSIVTLSLTIVFCTLAIKGQVDINSIYQIVIAFYFGTQMQKNEGRMNEYDNI